MNKDKRNNIKLLGTLNNSDESGIIANANQIYDANEDKSTQDVSKEHTERIKTLEDKYKKSNYNDGDNIIDFNTIHLITDNPEFAIVAVDVNEKILYGIKTDGQPYFGVGCPQQVKDYIDEQINKILGTDDITTTIDSLKEIETFLKDFTNSDTLKALLDTKANKTDVDNTVANINADIADKYKKSNPNDKEGNVVDTNTIISVDDNPEYVKALTDSVGKLIEAIGLDGVRKFFAGIEIQGIYQCVIDNPEYTIAWVDKENRIIFAIKKDGTFYIGGTLQIEGDIILKGNIKNLKVNVTRKVEVKVTGNNCSVWPRKLSKHLSMASHITGTSMLTRDYPYRDKLAESCAELNVYSVRSDIVIPNTTNFNFTNFDNAFYQLNKNGIEIIGLIYFDWHRTDLIDIFSENVATLVNRYNGITDIYPTDADGEAVRIKISMWELFNEPATDDINALALMSRVAYTTIKSIDPTSIVLMPSSYSLTTTLLDDILHYQYEDNTSFLDYFDVINLHYYGGSAQFTSINNLRKVLEDLAELRNNKTFLDKTVWITETGQSLYYYTEKEQANKLVNVILGMLSYGVDNVFMFQQRSSCTNYRTNLGPKEWYWGVLKDCTKNSYLSLTTINGDNLSPGDGYKKIIAVDGAPTIPISYSEVSKLKTDGLKVSGDKYTLIKIEIVRSGSVIATPYSGTFVADGSTSLDINSTEFISIANGDTLKFTLSSAIVNNEFDSLQKNKSYFALSYLYSIAGDGSIPKQISFASIDLFTFVTKDNKPITAIINKNNKNIDVKTDITDINAVCRDIEGNRKDIDLTDFVLSAKDIIYIENVDNFTLEY